MNYAWRKNDIEVYYLTSMKWHCSTEHTHTYIVRILLIEVVTSALSAHTHVSHSGYQRSLCNAVILNAWSKTESTESILHNLDLLHSITLGLYYYFILGCCGVPVGSHYTRKWLSLSIGRTSTRKDYCICLRMGWWHEGKLWTALHG